MKFESNSAQDFDVSAIKSFAWNGKNPLNMEGMLSGSDYPRLRRRLMDETARILGERGLVKVDPDKSPDVLISFSVGLSLGIAESNQITSSERGSFEPSSFYVQTTDFFDGNLTIEIVDALTRRFVWEGRVITRSARMSPGDDAELTTTRKVQRILDGFLPP